MKLRPETEARYRRATEAKYGETFSDKTWQEMVDWFLVKRNARYQVAKALAAGSLVQTVCQIRGCHSRESEAHHPCYRHATDIIWLCPLHHAREHSALRRMSQQDRAKRNQEMLDAALHLRYGNAIIVDTPSMPKTEAMPEIPEVEWGNDEDFQDTIIEYDEDAKRQFEDDEGVMQLRWFKAMTKEQRANIIAAARRAME